MKYVGMPMGMWVLFAGSFRKQLSAVYGYDTLTAKAITGKAKPKYPGRRDQKVPSVLPHGQLLL